MATGQPHTRRQEPPRTQGRWLLFAFLCFGLLLCALLLYPFVPALTGTLLLALITRPQIAWLRRHIRSSTWVATSAIVAVSICIVIPAFYAATAVLERCFAAVALLQNPAVLARLREVVRQLQAFLATTPLPANSFDPSSAVNSGISFLGSTAISFLSGSVSAITQIVVMLFLLFFWYRDEDRFRDRARRLFALTPTDMRFLTRRLKGCIYATVLGRLIVAAVQGILAWGVFLAMGVPGAPLLANATAVCALIPAFGAFVVWLPVVVYLLVIHAWVKAIILTLVGSLVLSTIDNILFPILAGSRSHMDTAEMFLAVFGGITLFGIPGLVVGPLVWVATETLIAIWHRPQLRRQ